MHFDLSDLFIIAFITLVFGSGCMVLYKLMRSKNW